MRLLIALRLSACASTSSTMTVSGTPELKVSGKPGAEKSLNEKLQQLSERAQSLVTAAKSIREDTKADVTVTAGMINPVDAWKALTEAFPRYETIDSAYQSIEAEVSEVHDLHIWLLSYGKPAMTVHLKVIHNPEVVLKKATLICRRSGIYHSTIQVEKQDDLNCDHNIHTKI